MFNVEVRQGRMIVNAVDLTVDLPTVKMYYVDMVSKYPGAPVEFTSGTHLGIMIPTGEGSIGINGSTTEETEIAFHGPADLRQWRIMADVARYTVRVCLYLPDWAVNRTLVWQRSYVG